MGVPVWSAGQVLASADVNNWFVPIPREKTIATTRSSNVVSADPDLSMTLAANSFYKINCSLLYAGATGGIGFTATFTTPASSAGGFSAAIQSGTLGFTWGNTLNLTQSSSSTFATQIEGILQTGGSSGTFAVNWASGTNGTNMTLGIGSYLIARLVG
jgi:hypothetical protein